MTDQTPTPPDLSASRGEAVIRAVDDLIAACLSDYPYTSDSPDIVAARKALLDIIAASAGKAEPAPVAVDVSEVEKLVDDFGSAEYNCGYEVERSDNQLEQRASKKARKALLTTIRQLASVPVAVPAELREQAALVADQWLETFGRVEPEHVSAQTWACGAVKDIAQAIRALPIDALTEYERRCSFDQVALDTAIAVEAIFYRAEGTREQRLARVQIAITDLLMAHTPHDGRLVPAVTTREMEEAGRNWAHEHDPTTFADIFDAMCAVVATTPGQETAGSNACSRDGRAE